jgi:hypothetical protein
LHNQRIKSVAYRSIFHCAVSSAANVIGSQLPVLGPLLQMLLLVAAMHMLFNVVLPDDSLFYLCCNMHSVRFASEWDELESLPNSKRVVEQSSRRVALPSIRKNMIAPAPTKFVNKEEKVRAYALSSDDSFAAIARSVSPAVVYLSCSPPCRRSSSPICWPSGTGWAAGC